MAQALRQGNSAGTWLTRYRPLSIRFTPKAALTSAMPGLPPLARWLRRQMLMGLSGMFGKIGRLFVIKTRFEAFLIIYALALGATSRGSVYLTQFLGFGGKLLFLACTGAVFMAGAKILDCLKFEREKREAEAVAVADQFR
jgi:hypothetical protein